MEKKNFRTLEYEGRSYRFNRAAFCEFFRAAKSRTVDTNDALTQKIAEHAYVSADAVINWKKGKNGPSDIEKIRLIAEALGVNNWMLLLAEIREENDMRNREEIELYSVKRIYDAVVEFLHEFVNTDGFNSYWHGLFEESSLDVEGRLYDLVESKYDKVILAYEKEKMLLMDHPIYDEIGSFLYNEDGLPDCYEEKLSYAYRFEGMAEDPPVPTAKEDALEAIGKLDGIIRKYF